MKKTLLTITTLLSIATVAFSDTIQPPAPSKELMLGYEYMMGITQPKDNVKARAYFEMAAKNHDETEAYSILSYMYQVGIGGEVNLAKSIEILKQLADKEDPVAQSQLASQYYSGSGIDQDFTKSFFWFNKSYENDPNNFFSNDSLAELYYTGLGAQQDFTQAFKHYKTAAEQGYGQSQAKLATMYLIGLGTDKDPEQARYWAEKANRQGDSYATQTLFSIHHYGIGNPIDFKQSFKLIFSAALRGDASAQTGISAMYLLGLGVEPNINTSYEWRKKSCEGGFKSACEFLENSQKNANATAQGK